MKTYICDRCGKSEPQLDCDTNGYHAGGHPYGWNRATIAPVDRNNDFNTRVLLCSDCLEETRKFVKGAKS